MYPQDTAEASSTRTAMAKRGVTGAIDDQEMAVEKLSAMTSELAEKLESILRPAEPEPAVAGLPDAFQPCSPSVERLRSVERGIRRCQQMVGSLLERLDA